MPAILLPGKIFCLLYAQLFFLVYSSIPCHYGAFFFTTACLSAKAFLFPRAAICFLLCRGTSHVCRSIAFEVLPVHEGMGGLKEVCLGLLLWQEVFK